MESLKNEKPNGLSSSSGSSLIVLILSRKKTNLMVFLRPKIIRSASDARPLTQELLNRARREDMLQSQRLTSKIDDYLSDTEQPALSNDK